MKTAIKGVMFAAVLLVAGQVSAMTWNPTDGDVNVVDISTAGGAMFGLFDAGLLPGAATPSLLIASVDTIVFTQLGNGTWDITNLANVTFNLGSTASFQFGYFDGTDWVEEASATEFAPGSNIWNLSWGGPSVSILAVDIAPIPVPAALWLFASGLLGLLAIRRGDR